jgi:3-hydroxyanthranilate 3,4-dioxygenase
MGSRVSTRRKNNFNLFREAKRLASFDEFPMLRPEVDPQIHLSHNEVDQPFYLTCEKDTVLAQSSGASRVIFREGPVRYFDLGLGDYAYVPAGTTHRVLTVEPGNLLRYKARDAGMEAVSWLCESCGSELDQHLFNTQETLPQAAYQLATERFNADTERRTCKACGKVHPPVNLEPFRWSAVAEALNAAEEEDA